ncbi:hypothetical protein PV08_09903 [Exophiala spinifera]|uniref:Uncharacterized protein n=1 Tax=Exophiala spinifera TaxID=91928 RepID=A0A0D2B1Z8_9EURO|nr:uncharacterized protein PV08_09903 [Exophiala spinifera]KIW12625.1 hypothetical protein PV08_09903 [Exophiala spinifera]
MASPTATAQGHGAMATAPAPPNATGGTSKSRTIVAVSVLLGVLFIVIMLVWWTSGKRRPQEPSSMPVIYRHVIEEKRKTAVSNSFVESMPLVKYGTVIRVAQMDNRTDEEANIAIKGKVFVDAARRSECPVCVENFTPSDEQNGPEKNRPIASPRSAGSKASSSSGENHDMVNSTILSSTYPKNMHGNQGTQYQPT